LKITKNFSFKFKHQLREKYKLVVMNRNTFEEMFSIELTLLFVFVFISISTLILIGITTLLITITPLREFIPGYGSAKHEQKIISLQKQIDSLNQKMTNYDVYRQHIQKIFVDEDFADDTIAFQSVEPVKSQVNTFAFSKEDSLLMQINIKGSKSKADEEKNVSKKDQKQFALLFSPLKGDVVSIFNPADNEYGINLKSDNNLLYSITSGNVVFFAEEINASIVIVIQHPDDMLSVYRYRGVSSVEQGDLVKTGQLIGKALTVPMMLNFELWIKGKPVNPENHITF
jgi:hypothetical protein